MTGRELDEDGWLPVSQALSAAAWSPASWWHAGQLAWDHASPQAASYRMAVFGPEDEPTAWARVADGTHLQAQTSPGSPATDEIVEWFEDVGGDGALTAEIAAAELDLLAGLGVRGFDELPDGPFSLDLRRPADADVLHELPDGYVVRPVAGHERAEAVAAHRAAWRPADLPFHPDRRPAFAPGAESAFSEEAHARVAATWPYRPELDLAVVAPDGAFVGSCIAWLDPRTGAAEIEPLGIAPEHRGRGLARCLVLHATAAVARLGGTEMVIQPRGDDAYPAPRHTYFRCGFEQVNRTHLLARPALDARRR